MTKDLRHLCELALLKLDGEITVDQVQELDRLLRDRADAQQFYLEIMAVCSGLSQHAQFEEATAEEPAAAEEASNTQASLEEQRIIKECADQQLQAFLDEQAEMRRQQDLCASRRSTVDVYALGRRVLRTLDRAVVFARKAAVRTAAIAAILFVVLAGYRHYTLSRPIATLGRTQDAVWEKAPESEALLRGRLVLKSGYAQVNFLSGARILVKAPCDFHLTSPASMVLTNGTITSRVPPEARGFAVETPAGRIVDLGTEFGLSVSQQGDTVTAVFDGTVQVTRTAGDANVLLRENQQVKTSSLGVMGTVQTLDSSHRFRRTWDDVAYLPEATGSCRILRTPPANVGNGRLQDSDTMVVFLERRTVFVTQDVGPVTCQSGRILYSEQPADRILAGQAVDSYLVHFDPATRDHISCSAQIRFPRPVVGIISTNEVLLRTDSWCGNPRVVYTEFGPSRQSEPTLEDDEIILSPDRMTVSCTFWTIRDGIDQLRILIESVPFDEASEGEGITHSMKRTGR